MAEGMRATPLIQALISVESTTSWLASTLAENSGAESTRREAEYRADVTNVFRRLHEAIDHALLLAQQDVLKADLLELRGLIHPIYFGQDGLGLVRVFDPPSMPPGFNLPLRSIYRQRLLLQFGIGEEPSPPARRPKRTNADIISDEGTIGAYLTDNPETTRDQLAEETGIAPAHVSSSRAWQSHTSQKRQARASSRPLTGLHLDRESAD